MWYWNFFLAREWRKGPGFIAGDAAHSWPPFGALGGNSAYGDVVNLSWKLAAVCKGIGGDTLLDSYAAERRQNAIQTALYVMSITPRTDIINKYIIPYAKSPIVRTWIRAHWYFANSGKHNGNHFSQSGVQLGTHFNYSPVLCTEHPLTDDPFCDYLPVIRAGGRLPFYHIPSPEEPSVFVGIYDLVLKMGYTLFVVRATEEGVLNDQVTGIVDSLTEHFHKLGVPFDVVLSIFIADLKNLDVNRGGTRTTALELWSQEQLILVRPDHVVAWHLPRKESVCPFKQSPETIVSIVTGLAQAKIGDWVGSERHKRMMNYQDWLTKQFRFNLRTYQFLFPNSVPVHNETKEQAVQRAKEKGGATKTSDTKTAFSLTNWKQAIIDAPANSETTAIRGTQNVTVTAKDVGAKLGFSDGFCDDGGAFPQDTTKQEEFVSTENPIPIQTPVEV